MITIIWSLWIHGVLARRAPRAVTLGTLEAHGLVSKHGPLWQRVDLVRR